MNAHLTEKVNQFMAKMLIKYGLILIRVILPDVQELVNHHLIWLHVIHMKQLMECKPLPQEQYMAYMI